jgi:hypothetical protein
MEAKINFSDFTSDTKPYQNAVNRAKPQLNPLAKVGRRTPPRAAPFSRVWRGYEFCARFTFRVLRDHISRSDRLLLGIIIVAAPGGQFRG